MPHEDDSQSVGRSVAERDQQGRGQCHRAAESGRALQKKRQEPTDQNREHNGVLRDLLQPILDHEQRPCSELELIETEPLGQ
jgi:hypothetical protein